MLRARSVSVAYGKRRVVEAVDLDVAAGELVVVLGPNGAGKSSLIRACLGLVPLTGGSVEIAERPIHAYSRRELARLMAWVPQAPEAAPGFTGLELVLMGRAPHLGLWGVPSRADVEMARSLLADLGVAGLAERPNEATSGGERRLLWLAKAFAQAPRALVLDEPTAFLDLRHQVEALRQIRRRVREGLAALVVLHDLNLAAAFADRVVLLKGGRVLEKGGVGEVLTPAVLERAFDVPMSHAEVAGQRLFAPRAP